MDSSQDQYRNLLMDIKRRTALIYAFNEGDTHAIYRITTIESSCLQIRKILELIAFGSLVANIEIYSKEYKKFATHWNAKFILKDMARINPEFYPHPIIQKPSIDTAIHSEWENIPELDYLTQSDFVDVYEKCGAILHAANPFGKQIDTLRYQNDIPIWCAKIINLLNAHTIRLVGDNKHVYLFQMGAKEKWPSYTPFERIRKITEDTE